MSAVEGKADDEWTSRRLPSLTQSRLERSPRWGRFGEAHLGEVDPSGPALPPGSGLGRRAGAGEAIVKVLRPYVLWRAIGKWTVCQQAAHRWTALKQSLHQAWKPRVLGKRAVAGK